MKSMRIAVDCRMINASGIGTCIRAWLPILLAEQPGWQFVLLGDPAALAAFSWTSSPRVTIQPLHARVYSIAEQVAFFKIVSRRVDLLWVPHFNIPLLWPGKLLVTVHDVIFLAMPELFSKSKQAYAALFLQRIRWRADAVHFVSHFTSSEFKRLVGTPRGAVAVIHNRIEESWWDMASCRAEGGRGKAEPYIICVGNVKPSKNLRRLIEAFQRIAPQIPHRLLIIGKKDGFMTRDAGTESYAASDPRITFSGYVTDVELKQFVKGADLLVHPSLYEGFGLVPVEALSVGCRIAVSRIPAHLEVCGDRATYFDPLSVESIGDAILDVLRHGSPPSVTRPPAQCSQLSTLISTTIG